MIDLLISLRDVIEREIGEPTGRRRQPFWRCPFPDHDDRTPSFTILPDGRRWMCHGCGRSGDAIDFIKLRYNVGFKEALEYLQGGSLNRIAPIKTIASQRKVDRQREAELAAERERFSQYAEGIVQECTNLLFSSQGTRARQWLQLRGLSLETVRQFRLGYNPKSRTVSGIWLDRGITVPWINGKEIQGLKIRRPVGDPKYRWVKGQNRSGLFPGHLLRRGLSTVITEGEFDCLLGYQEFGDIADVATLGSADDPINERALGQLLTSTEILLCYDRDRAGQDATHRWLSVMPNAKVITIPEIPEVKDLTDLYRVTGDLRTWIHGRVHSFSLTLTLHPTPGVIC